VSRRLHRSFCHDSEFVSISEALVHGKGFWMSIAGAGWLKSFVRHRGTADKSAWRAAAVLFVLLQGYPATGAGAATLPAGYSETVITSQLNRPTAMDFAPDRRLFVTEQGGNVRIIKNGVLLPTPFVSLTVDQNGERGLLGVAFHPSFVANPYVYLYYTVPGSPPHNRVSRFRAAGDLAQAGSEEIILELDNLSSATNHNGGAIHFGADRYLYVAVGDNANPSNAQSLTNRLGKVLRVNSKGGIPSDNPFYATATGKNRAIWVYGLRNPYTFSVQRGTGKILVNDVGQGSWEEINLGVKGGNYGWPATEGPTNNPEYTSPVYAYPHSGGAITGCAITGGAFYNPATVRYPANFVGTYFFADFCSGWIRRLNVNTGKTSGFARGYSQPVDLKVSVDGYLYVLTRGALTRIRYTAPN